MRRNKRIRFFDLFYILCSYEYYLIAPRSMFLEKYNDEHNVRLEFDYICHVLFLTYRSYQNLLVQSIRSVSA